MPVALALNPINVDASANNFIYAVITLTFSGSYSTGGDTIDFTTIADKLLSTQIVSLFAEGASSTTTAVSQSGGFYTLLGNCSVTPGQTSPVPTALNSWKIKVFTNSAGSVTELSAGAYPAAVTSDNVQIVITLRKML